MVNSVHQLVNTEKLSRCISRSETGEFTLEADLTIDETEKLLKWSSGMNLNIAGYIITLTKDGETKDFTGELTRVRAQTAMLSIDYGPGSTNKNEKHLISTKNSIWQMSGGTYCVSSIHC